MPGGRSWAALGFLGTSNSFSGGRGGVLGFPGAPLQCPGGFLGYPWGLYMRPGAHLAGASWASWGLL